MNYIDAFNTIEAFREKLKPAVDHDTDITLDTESCEKILEALDSVDY